MYCYTLLAQSPFDPWLFARAAGNTDAQCDLEGPLFQNFNLFHVSRLVSLKHCCIFIPPPHTHTPTPTSHPPPGPLTRFIGYVCFVFYLTSYLTPVNSLPCSQVCCNTDSICLPSLPKTALSIDTNKATVFGPSSSTVEIREKIYVKTSPSLITWDGRCRADNKKSDILPSRVIPLAPSPPPP